MTYKHTPFSAIPILRNLFERVTPYDGSARTVNVAHYFRSGDDAKSFEMMAATTFRTIMDAGEDGYCLVVMDAGVEQTSPFSPFRFSQNELFD